MVPAGTYHNVVNASKTAPLKLYTADTQRKDARSALVSLCEGYWYPLYAYIRRRGYPADQAQDLTQEFFIRVLEGRYLDRADQIGRAHV